MGINKDKVHFAIPLVAQHSQHEFYAMAILGIPIDVKLLEWDLHPILCMQVLKLCTIVVCQYLAWATTQIDKLNSSSLKYQYVLSVELLIYTGLKTTRYYYPIAP